ncbi:MAG: glycosyltransferase family 4 protein [Pseudomonadota bacterium]|nr:glycosyltransferase family 4 protein [Pseudomonadota bacterium]
MVTLDTVPHIFQYMPWLAPIAPPKGTNVIVANSWNAAAFARHRIPLVSVCHLVVHDERLGIYKSWRQRAFHRHFVFRMEKIAIGRATVNVAVSPLVARQMKQIFGAEHVVTVNNGVDTEYFAPAEPFERQTDGPFRLLFVGKPSLRKGFDIAARIVERLGDRVSFTCVGAEPAPDLPRPRGHYTGFLDRSALREAYRQADLLLFPSRMEGLSLAVAEAMSCGLPILTCEGSGMDEFIPLDGGIVRPESDIAGFVEEIELAIRQPERHSKMRRLSREFAAEHLSEERWAKEMEEVLMQSRAESEQQGLNS